MKFGVGLKSGIPPAFPRCVALSVPVMGEGESLADAALPLNSDSDGVRYRLQPFAFATQLSGLLSCVFDPLPHYLLLQARRKI